MAYPHIFNICDAMNACDVNDVNIFLGDAPAFHLATDIFRDDFTTCMDKTFEELDSNFKTCSDLTQEQGRIRLLPGINCNIKALIQWVKDEQQLVRNPETVAFSVVQAPALLRHYKTHAQFVLISLTLADAVKPDKFTSETKWADWIPTFLNYLRAIPGRDKVPLKYNYRENNIPNLAPNAHFLDNYINMAPLTGEAYVIDSSQVHTFIVNFASRNKTTEAKIQSFAAQTDGRIYYQALVNHYEGIRVHTINITKA